MSTLFNLNVPPRFDVLLVPVDVFNLIADIPLETLRDLWQARYGRAAFFSFWDLEYNYIEPFYRAAAAQLARYNQVDIRRGLNTDGFYVRVREPEQGGCAVCSMRYDFTWYDKEHMLATKGLEIQAVADLWKCRFGAEASETQIGGDFFYEGATMRLLRAGYLSKTVDFQKFGNSNHEIWFRMKERA